MQTSSGIYSHGNYFYHLKCSAREQEFLKILGVYQMPPRLCREHGLLRTSHAGRPLKTCGRISTQRQPTAASREAPTSRRALWGAVRGCTAEENSSFDFTWLNNKSSRKGKPNRQENKAQPTSPDRSAPRGLSAEWPASCAHGNIKPAWLSQLRRRFSQWTGPHFVLIFSDNARGFGDKKNMD